MLQRLNTKTSSQRDFFHEAIHEEFSPIQMAYTVGLVGWKNESDRGFGPGYEKKGIFGPGKDDLKDLRVKCNFCLHQHILENFASNRGYFKIGATIQGRIHGAQGSCQYGCKYIKGE